MKNPASTPVLRGARSSGRDSGWSGLGEAWTYLSYLISGIGVWGGIGWGLDAWLGTKPVCFVIGALVGNFAGIYLVYLRAFPKTGQKEQERGVSRRAA